MTPTEHTCDIFPYRVPFNNIESHCSLRIFAWPEKIVIIATESENNPGASITHDIESLMTQIYHNVEIKRALPYMTKYNVTLIQHYANLVIPTWDAVSFEWDEEKREFMNPSWRPVRINELKELTGNKLP